MLVRDEQTFMKIDDDVDDKFHKSTYRRQDSNNNDTNNNEIFTSDRNGNLIDRNRTSIKSFYQNACILVTGGTGFLGN